MTDKETGGPAFPRTGERCQSINEEGMTLLDYLAGHALAGYLAAHAGVGVTMPQPCHAAERAYAYARAMLEERSK